MILKALYDYYHRSGDLAPAGMEMNEISFLIVIDKEGQFIRLEDRRIDNKKSSKFLVSKRVGRSSAPVANILWDNCAYVLGISEANLSNHNSDLSKRKDNIENELNKNSRCNSTFITQVEKLYEEHKDSVELCALLFFYRRYDKKQMLEKLQQESIWEEFSKNLTKNISFIIEGDTEIIAEKKHLFPKKKETSCNKGLCLITGSLDHIIETTSSTSIPGGQATGKLVSFQIKSGYDSYGKSQGKNAPISIDAEFCYTTALKMLLDKDSNNKFHISTRTFVFWASSDNEDTKKIEQNILNLFGFVKDLNDDPNYRIEEVHKFFKAIYSGYMKIKLDDKFYFLGLAPNAARIAVVYWNECTLENFAKNMLQHLEDMNILDTRKEKKPFFGLHSIINAVAPRGKASDVQPNLTEAIIKSILQGIPYPYALYNACINRIRSEQNENQSVTISRAAIIKAYLNRLYTNDKKLGIMIDKENTSQGYLYGRLFAVLEHIQEKANGNSTIRSRYMNSASATPAVVFPTILNLSTHHVEKLNKGTQIWYEQIKSEIIDKITVNGFQNHLSLPEQGRFFVGYYHQRQDLYSKKEDTTNEL